MAEEFPMVIGRAFTPHIGNTIFKLLDKSALLKSRSVSSDWKDIVDVETDLWADPDLYMSAALKGNVDLCKKIIDCPRTVDKNPARYLGATPLHWAAFRGHLNVCQLILENVQEKNPPNNAGETPLHMATSWGRLDVCQLILENVQEKNPADGRGRTPLHTAAYAGHLDIAQLIIKNVEQKNPPDKYGNTPLHYAAKMYISMCARKHVAKKYSNKGERLEICCLILRSIEEKHPVNASGETPLAAARSQLFGQVS